MTRLICSIFGHCKPNIHYPRQYRDGVMHYQCKRCECWTTDEGKRASNAA